MSGICRFTETVFAEELGGAALIIIVVFGLVAGLVAMTLVESYIVINASVIFIAFAGLKFTSDIAIHALKYAIGVGVKLFALQLIVGVAMSVFQAWTQAYANAGLITTIEDGMGLAGLAILVFYLAVYLPPALAGMVTGMQSSGMQFGAAATGATAIAGGSYAIAASVMGGASALQGAGSLASAQLTSAEAAGTAPTSGVARMVSWTGNAAANLTDAALHDIGARLGGRPGAHSGTMGGRMGDGMRARGEMLIAALNTPKPPGGTTPASSSTGGPATGNASSASPSASPEPANPAPASENPPQPGGSLRGET